MIAYIQIICGSLTIISFFIFLLFNKYPYNQTYVLFLIYALPFLNIDFIPGDYSITIFEIITFVMMPLILFDKRRTPNKSFYESTPLVLFFISILIGIFLQDKITNGTLFGLTQLISLMFFGNSVLSELKHNKRLEEMLLKAFRWSLICSFIFLILQFAGGADISLSKSANINVKSGEIVRYTSFFQDPQKYAQYLSMLGLTAFIPIHTKKKRNTYGILLAILCAAIILITGSRAAFGAMISGLIIIELKMRRIKIILFAGTIVAATFLLFKQNLAISNRASLEDSYDFRNEIWKDALKIYQENLVFGIGTGNYSEYVKNHNPDQFWEFENEITYYDHPESGYLKWLVEFGTIGFCTIIFFICKPILLSLFMKNKTNSIFYAASLISFLIGFYTLYSIGDIRIGIIFTSILSLLYFENKNWKTFRKQTYLKVG